MKKLIEIAILNILFCMGLLLVTPAFACRAPLAKQSSMHMNAAVQALLEYLLKEEKYDKYSNFEIKSVSNPQPLVYIVSLQEFAGSNQSTDRNESLLYTIYLKPSPIGRGLPIPAGCGGVALELDRVAESSP